MASYQLSWKGPETLQRALQGAAEGLTRYDLAVEAEAKKELYPGHGLITGTLRRSVVGEPGRVAGSTRAEGRIAAKGVPYARRLHRRYEYLTTGEQRTRPRAVGIISPSIKKAIAGG